MNKPTKDQVATGALIGSVLLVGGVVYLQDRKLKLILKQNLEETTALIKKLDQMEQVILEDSRLSRKSHDDLEEVNQRITSVMEKMVTGGDTNGSEG